MPRARIVVLHGMRDAAIVEACGFRDQIELIGDCKLDVAVGVVEQLGEFRLARAGRDQLGRNRRKQGRRRLRRLRAGAADDLWGFFQLRDAPALHHPLRAERHPERAAATLEIAVEPVGSARGDGGAQHQQLAIGKMRQQHVDAVLYHLPHRVQEFVDRSTYGDDHRHTRRDVRGLRGENQLLARQRSGQQPLAAELDEGQPARAQAVEHGAVDIVHVDPKSGLGKGQHQRNAHMPATADHGQVSFKRARRHRRGGVGKIHAPAPSIIAMCHSSPAPPAQQASL